jgi:type II secretory pathway pseudopilin PulG
MKKNSGITVVELMVALLVLVFLTGAVLVRQVSAGPAADKTKKEHKTLHLKKLFHKKSAQPAKAAAPVVK